MHMRPGLEVVRLGFPGEGQVVGIDSDGLCEVVWQRGGKREYRPESDLVWRGFTLHTRDGRVGHVIELGARGRVRVRLSNGARCWMAADEFEPRQPKQAL